MILLSLLFAMIILLIFIDRFITNLNQVMSVDCPFCQYSKVRERNIDRIGDNTARFWGFYLAFAASKPQFHCPKCEKTFGISELSTEDGSEIVKYQKRIRIGMGIFLIMFIVGFLLMRFKLQQ